MYTGLKAVVLDFDGTVFRLFTNYDLKATSVKIHGFLKEHGLDFPPERDAFDAFGFVFSSVKDCQLRERLLARVDEIVTEAELEALSSGILTDGFYSFLDKCRGKGVKTAIASNNSKRCIEKFLSDGGVTAPVPVTGRIGTRPDLMKPHAYLLETACKELGLTKDDIVYVGDNARDGACAENFGCGFIALTPTDKKRERILKAMPRVTAVDDFYGLGNILGL